MGRLSLARPILATVRFREVGAAGAVNRGALASLIELVSASHVELTTEDVAEIAGVA